jgi:hypothetical protein
VKTAIVKMKTSMFLVAAFCLFMAGCAANIDGQKSTVTHYASGGKAIRTWTNAQSVDPAWTNTRVEFYSEGKRVVLFGTVVIDHDVVYSTGPATHTVTLYGGDGSVIRSWAASQVDPAWSNDRVQFVEAETGHQFTVIGTVGIEQR